jgi:hypothetical protein
VLENLLHLFSLLLTARVGAELQLKTRRMSDKATNNERTANEEKVPMWARNPQISTCFIASSERSVKRMNCGCRTNLGLGQAESLLIETVSQQFEDALLIRSVASNLTDNITDEDLAGTAVLNSEKLNHQVRRATRSQHATQMKTIEDTSDYGPIMSAITDWKCIM